MTPLPVTCPALPARPARPARPAPGSICLPPNKKTNVDSFIHLAGRVDSAAIGHNRVVQFPAKSWTLADIWGAAQAVGAEEGIRMGKMTLIEANDGDTTVKEINVCPRTDCAKAARLGFPMTVDLKGIIRDYVHRYVRPAQGVRARL